MKIAILSALCLIVVLLSTVLYLLFVPIGTYQESRSRPTLRAQYAAVGHAALMVAQRDPAVAAMLRAAVAAASDEERATAADLIAGLPKQ